MHVAYGETGNNHARWAHGMLLASELLAGMIFDAGKFHTSAT